MRLGQLTRQLNIDATQVVNFLKIDGIDIENHPNTKLGDEDVKKLFDKFKVEETEKIIAEVTDVIDPIIVDSSESIIEEVIEQVSLTETDSEAVDEITIEDTTEIEVPSKSETTDESLKTELSSSIILDEEVEIITLPKEEVDKLIEAGEIVSDIEAEAATLSESETIKAKFTTLEGLNVKGKIDLPHDARRERKEAARKVEAEVLKEKSNAGKTINGVHPNKRAKEEGEKIKEDLLKAEEEAIKRLERKKLKAEKEAAKLKKNSEKKKKGKKKSKKPLEKVLSPEELKKKAAREKRQKAKDKANAPAAPRNFWQKIWDVIK